MNRLAPPRLALLAVASVVALAACSVPVANGLDEADANRVVVALDRASIGATKDADPSTEGRFRVLVSRDDAARALVAMHDEELPRPRPAGVLDAVDKGALVPSRAAEHAEIVAGLSGDLERTLEGIDGVLAARVHLNVPAADPLQAMAPARAPKATASVLLEHRGPTSPIASDAVQRLVAGGVAGLAPEDVAVVTVARAAPSPTSAPLAHVGPFHVSPGSVRPLQALLGALILVVALLAATTLFLYTRLARVRAEPLPSTPPPS